jgi:hypothetical protein
MNELMVLPIGRSDHPIGKFIELLNQHEITSVVDIRRFPASRKFPISIGGNWRRHVEPNVSTTIGVRLWVVVEDELRTRFWLILS